MTAALTWFEVTGPDTHALRDFYGTLFGWEFQPLPGMDYGVVQGSVPGGIGEQMGPESWITFYVRVDDVDERVALVREKGLDVLVPPTDLPAVPGQPAIRIAVVRDPAGHALGLSAEKPAN